jgi:Leucine-rich repeat (LRR) protein
MTHQTSRTAAHILLLCILLFAGCDDTEPESTLTAADQARRAARNDTTTLRVDPKILRQQLGANEMARFLVEGNDIVEANLFRSGLRSVDPLKGLPLRGLDLGFTYVSDLSPLTGMPLESLILENTSVADLSPLKGMPLKVLKIQNTKVTDFGFLEGMKLTHFNVLNLPFSDLNAIKDMPLNTLWVTGSKVTDLTPLTGCRLVSLDIERTEVSDVGPLATMSSLKRLNIALTQVTDLSPLAGLSLERIVLSPERIRAGIDAIRNMKSLVEIQTTVEQNQAADEFWKRYDLGIWDDSKKSSTTNPAPEPATETPVPGATPSIEPEVRTP